LKEVNADVICLQELTVNHPDHNKNVDVPRFLADGLGFEFFYKEAEKRINDSKEDTFGNAIYSRFPLSKQAFHYIQESPVQSIENDDYSKEGRVYVEVMVRVDGRDIQFGTVHMSYTDRFQTTAAKETETNKLLDILRTKRNNFIFTGDFNALPESYTISEVSKVLKSCGPSFNEKTWTTKPFSYNGFDATTLDWRLDYCFATPDAQVKSARVIETDFSDHLPILVEV
jgi:endonuclease/exonuclease/phosphatase family metal-dependent hydrolase